MTSRLLVTLLCVSCCAVAAAESAVEPIRSAINASDWKAALSLAEEWTDRKPGSSDAHYWLALALREKMESVSKIRALASVGNYTDALERAIELDPRNVDALQEHIGYLIHAPGIAGGDRDQAKKEIVALEKIDPVGGQQMRLELAQKEHDPSGQIEALKALRSLDPGNVAYDYQEAMLRLDQHDFEKADRLLATAATSDQPDVALGASYQRARWRIMESRDLATARDLLTAYVEQRSNADSRYAPSRAAAYWRLGLAYEGLGERDDAVDAMETCLQLDPDFKQAAKDLKRLRRGR